MDETTTGGPVRRAVLDGLMTDDEHEAVMLAGRVACLLDRIAGPDRSRADLAEMCAAIHTVQNAVLAQAAARAFPDRYRLMGASPVQDVRAAVAWPTCGCDPSLVAPRSGPWTCPHGTTWRFGVEGDPYCWTPEPLLVGRAAQSVDIAEDTRRMVDEARGTGVRHFAADGVSDVVESITAHGVVELDPTVPMRLPRYRLRQPAPFRWRDVITVEAELSDYGSLPYGACPVDGPHEAHRWAISGAETPDEVPGHAWWLCDPKPGLTGDSHGDLDRLAAWSGRHPDGEMPRPHAWRVKLERCPRCGSDTCPGRGYQLDCTAELDGLTAHAEASQLLREKHTQMPPAPFTRADVDRAADEALRANPHRHVQ